MSDLIVSVSGIRGIVGESLIPADVCRFASALGTHLGGGRVLDLHVLEGERHDIGLFRVGVR